MSTKKADLGGKNPQWEPWLQVEKRLLPQREVNVYRFIAVLLLQNKDQQ